MSRINMDLCADLSNLSAFRSLHSGIPIRYGELGILRQLVRAVAKCLLLVLFVLRTACTVSIDLVDIVGVCCQTVETVVSR